METMLIKQIENVRELIDYILIARQSLLECIAIAIDVDYTDLSDLYDGKRTPSKKILLKLCNLYCLICIEDYGY